METTDYVSYPIALALKRAGFDWKCDHYYCAFDNETDVRFWSIHPAQSQNGLRDPKDKVIADAPTLAVAQKWLREKCGIAINVDAHDGDFYTWEAVFLSNASQDVAIEASLSAKFSPYVEKVGSYEAALSAGIAAALELITQ